MGRIRRHNLREGAPAYLVKCGWLSRGMGVEANNRPLSTRESGDRRSQDNRPVASKNLTF